MTYKEKFEKALTYISRDGVDDLVSWLKNDTDFFTSPCSTRFHGNFEGGLLEHSINVLEYSLAIYKHLLSKNPDLKYLKESVIISALFHDVCKANCYVKEQKWTKNAQDKWVQYEGWSFNEDFPIGHGEKSVYLISKYVKLTDPEALAIRWHMGTYEVGTSIEGPTKWSYQTASEHPLVRIIHSSDLMAQTLETTINHREKASNR